MDETKKKYVTTTCAISGHFAVIVWWNPEGFWEPWDTGFGRYLTKDEAVVEAKAIAEEEGLEYKA